LFAKYKSKVILINNVASTFFQVKINLIAAAQASGGSQTISYPYFVAFISLLSNIELIKKIYLNATNGSRTTEVTKGR
jgi:solute carrier family 25 aspartate/glutamate transporter 12/13